MEGYDGFHDELNEQPQPADVNDTGETPAAPETPVTAQAPEAAIPETPKAPEPEAAAARPEPQAPSSQPQGFGGYSDAGYIPSADAGAMPRSYHCAPAAEPRTKKERAPRRGMHPAAVVALCLVCALLGGLACGAALQTKYQTAPAAEQTEPAPAPEQAQRTIPSGETNAAAPSAETPSVIKVSGGDSSRIVTTNRVATGEMSATDIYYNLALEQVVGIKTEITYTNFFGYSTKAAVSGSGFVISEDGYILTNYHVIEDAVNGGYEVQVLTHDGSTYTAEVIGYESDNDVALLKIDATGLNAAVLGDSDAMKVGEQVYAVGNPTGELEYSMTEGIVSAKDRQITAANSSTGRTETVSVFQTTAAINGGNSGGPIYNSRGEVIGIVVAKKVSTEIEGLAFAIPINDAVRIAQDLINDGFVRGKAYMGIRVGTVTASAAQYYGLVQGAIVASVEEDSCAAVAGLKESDIIVAIDGKEITTGNELISAKKNYRAGDTAVLKVYRESQYIELSITFEEATPERLAAEQDNTQENADGNQNGRTQTVPGDDYSDFFREFFGGMPFGK